MARAGHVGLGIKGRTLDYRLGISTRHLGQGTGIRTSARNLD